LPVRVRAAASLGFVDWLSQCQQLASEGEAHQYCSLAAVQAQSGLGAGLLDHILIFENLPDAPQHQHTNDTEAATAVGFAPPDVSQVGGFAQTNYALNLIVLPGQTLGFRFSYNKLVYTATQLQAVADQLTYLFDQVVAEPNRPLGQLDLLTPAQQRVLLEDVNQTYVDYPSTVGLHELVAQRAARTPQAPALSWAGGQWSYAQLQDEATRLAAYLSQTCGLAPGDRVGLLSGASPWRVGGLLGILAAGGVVVPLEASLPTARLAHQLADAGVALVLVDEASLSALLPDGTPQLLLTNGGEPNQAAVSFTAPPAPNHPSLTADSGAALAYLIYTSGSSGPPKAVAIRHRSLVHRALYHIDYLDLTTHNAVLQFSALGFDAWLVETFMALLSGGRLVLLETATRNDLPALVDFLAQQQVNVAVLPPAYLQLLVGQELGSLHTLISTGEAASLAASLHFATHKRVYNGYGPTESCIGASFHRVDPDRATAYRQAGGIPIGRPFANTTIYVLDSERRLLPLGVEGELWVGGIGLAAGYWGRPELTAERFVDHPFQPGERLYRTGDRGWWNENGELVYGGRLDGQVQVRGMRVELGEIESVLIRGAGVAQAVVVQAAGSGQLVGYLTGTITPADTDALLAAVSQTLPTYMVPAQLVVLAELPLTTNGKLDRRALAERPLPVADVAFSAPQGEQEIVLAGAWLQVLGGGVVGRESDFFRAGGDSIKAIQIASRLYQQGYRLELKAIFQWPLLHEQARQLMPLGETGQQGPVRSTAKPVYDVTPSMSAQWILFKYIEEHVYNMQDLIKIEGEVDYTALEEAIRGLVARHESLRTTLCHVAGEIKQIIHPPNALPLNYRIVDFSQAADGAERAQEFMRAERFDVRFDLENEAFIRFRLLNTAGGFHLLVLTIHHLVADGTTIEIISKELTELYVARLESRECTLPALQLQFKDFVEWANKTFDLHSSRDYQAYWQQQLNYPGDYARIRSLYSYPEAKDSQSTSYRWQLGEEIAQVLGHVPPAEAAQLYGSMKKLARRPGAVYRTAIDTELYEALRPVINSTRSSMYSLMAAGLSLVVYRLSGQNDVIFCAPITMRSHPDLQDMVGCLMGTTMYRVRLSLEDTFETFLSEVHLSVLDGIKYKTHALAQILADLDVAFDSIGHIELNLIRFEENSYLVEKPFAEHLVIGHPSNDMDCCVIDHPNGALLNCLYRTDLFAPDRIELIFSELRHIFQVVSQQPGISLRQLLDKAGSKPLTPA
ncbi:non-ribosomal peptide synthetase, partial [Fibrella aquatilis]